MYKNRQARNKEKKINKNSRIINTNLEKEFNENSRNTDEKLKKLSESSRIMREELNDKIRFMDEKLEQKLVQSYSQKTI